jgi:hypothetical protein
LPATSALSKKKITPKKMKRFNLIQPPSGKSYDRHFEIIIECCRTIRLSDYQTVGLSDCRTIRLSDYQAVGLSGCRIIATLPFILVQPVHCSPENMSYCWCSLVYL